MASTQATELTKSLKGLSLKKKDGRPTFAYRGDNEKPIRAGGVIFFRRVGKSVQLLMIKCRNKSGKMEYEDFGGRTEKGDSSIEETVAREVDEESNGIFSRDDIQKQLLTATSKYNLISKYCLYLLELTEYIDPKEFGDIEIYEQIPRTVEWVNLNKIGKIPLHIRLKSLRCHKFLNQELRPPR